MQAPANSPQDQNKVNCRNPGRNSTDESAEFAARCPRCGYRVQIPCLICLTRSRLAARSTTAPHDEMSAEVAPIRVELHGPARRRYERLHARKLRQERRRRRWP